MTRQIDHVPRSVCVIESRACHVTSHRVFLWGKGTCQENFTTVCGCFGLDTARVKALGELKKERKKTKMTKVDFHRFQVHHFSKISSNLLATVRWGNAREQI